MDANSAQPKWFVSRRHQGRANPCRGDAARRPSSPGPTRQSMVWLETLSVSIAVAGLFGLLGLATVDAELTREWSGQASIPVLQSIKILGEELVVSAALLQVAGFLGALAALMFSLEVLVEEESRHELIDDLLGATTRRSSSGQLARPAQPMSPQRSRVPSRTEGHDHAVESIRLLQERLGAPERLIPNYA